MKNGSSLSLNKNSISFSLVLVFRRGCSNELRPFFFDYNHLDMAKYYFIDTDDTDETGCFPLFYIKQIMKEKGLSSMKVHEANIDYGSGHMYCNEFDTVGQNSEFCGKECPAYKPRNGKSGRCKHHRNTYTHGKQILIT